MELYEDLSIISETGHDRNPVRLLRNVTNLYPDCKTVETVSKSFNMCKRSNLDQSQK